MSIGGTRPFSPYLLVMLQLVLLVQGSAVVNCMGGVQGDTVCQEQGQCDVPAASTFTAWSTGAGYRHTRASVDSDDVVECWGDGFRDSDCDGTSAGRECNALPQNAH